VAGILSLTDALGNLGLIGNLFVRAGGPSALGGRGAHHKVCRPTAGTPTRLLSPINQKGSPSPLLNFSRIAI